MATTEERLAALEKQMAAWIDQQPTTYYTHQYSGEEIDAAVGRAVTGGALDTSVTNVSNQLGTFVRPNLLDNWYFGNPVDQRGGKIIPAGIPYYTTPDITLPEVGKTDKAYTVIGIKNYSGYGQRATISISGSVYYVWDQYAVRGYTGDWLYSFDRWKISPSATVSVSGGGLSVIEDFQQAILSTALILGQKYTMSVLSTDGRLGQLTFTLKQDVNINQGFGFGYFVIFRGDDKYWFRLYGTNEATYLAIKLELGSTQTLAHREGDKWILNEVPDYGEQLRRCQRYYQVHKAPYWFAKNDDGAYRLTLPIPPMRTIPAATYDTFGTGTIVADIKNYTEDSVQFFATGVRNYCSVLNIKLSADL